MAAATFTANGAGGSNTPVIVPANTTVTLALTSVTGVTLIEWSIVSGSDSTQAPPVITPLGSPLGATATFPFGDQSASGLGLSWIVQCRINGGNDTAGTPVAAYTQRMLVGKVNANAILPFCPDEDLERNAINGIYQDLNKALKTVGGVGGTQDLVTTLGFGASAGGLKITTLGLCTVGGDAANKTYVDSRTLAQILAVSPSAGSIKITNHPTPTNGTDVANKAYVDSVAGAGAAQNLNGVLSTGNSAGGLNMTSLGFLSSSAELDVRQGANTILSTLTGITYVNASGSRLALRIASNDVVAVSDDSGGNSTILAGSSLRSSFLVTVEGGANSNGRTLNLFAGVATGTNKTGGIVVLRGTAGTGSGTIGYVDVQSTTASSLMTLLDTGITVSVPLTSTAAGSFTSVTAAFFAPGASVAGVFRMSVNQAITCRGDGALAAVDLNLVVLAAGNGLAIGSSTVPVTDLNSATLTRMRVAGINCISCTASIATVATPLELSSVLIMTPVVGSSVPVPSTGKYNIYLDSSLGDKLRKKDHAGTPSDA